MDTPLPLPNATAAIRAGDVALPIAAAHDVTSQKTDAPHRRALRMQQMVLAFYALDTLLLAGYTVNQTMPLLPVLAFGAAGGTLTAGFAFMAHRGLHRRIGGSRFTSLQLLSACGLMLMLAAEAPQVGLLLLMTVIVAVATAALQLRLRDVLGVCGLVAVGSLALMLVHGERFAMPLDHPWSRLLSGLWFAVVLAKIATINLMGEQMRKALAASNARLSAALAQVRELSERDELTGLPNRRAILTLLAEERARFARGGSAFGVAILDIDHFKRVNDERGHGKGDEVLQSFAKVVAAHLRSTDRVARYGGEEFLLLLPQAAELRLAEVAAERLRAAVEAHAWAEGGTTLKITCSVGLTISRAGEGIPEMLERADAALYRAKSEGRNRVCPG